MKFNSQGLAVAVFLFAMLGGAYYSSHQYFGVIYVDVGDGRGPAAIHRAYDVTGLEGMALSKKIHERLVGDAKVLTRDQNIGIELGQFATNKKITCMVYDRVQMVFIGEGQATSGGQPEMLVEGPCRNADENPLWIAPIWIPVDEITSRPTSTAEINLFDERKVSLKFSHIGDTWPRRWFLDSVRLSDEEDLSNDIVIQRSEIRQVAPQSILLSF